MRETAKSIAAAQSLMDVEDRLTSVREIFKLTGNDELEAASQRYLPASRNVHAWCWPPPAARRLARLTAERPKCMVDVRGKPLLHPPARHAQRGRRR